MKRFLLDSNIVLWWLSDPKKLSSNALSIISEGRTELFISVASLWEIEIKRDLGKLKAPKNIRAEIEKEGITQLPIIGSHIQKLTNLPKHHKDPFDRIIIAQALEENLVVVSSDKLFEKYPVKIIW